MIERSFCTDEIGGLLNVNSQQMTGFQNHYGNGGHIGPMYPQNQRSSFAIHELLGLGNTSCRQNVGSDFMESPTGMSSGNLMYFSRDLPMYNHCNFNPPSQPHQEPMGQDYVNIREATSQNQPNIGSTFCPWRVETLAPSTVNNQPHVHSMTPAMPKPESASYNYKMTSIGGHEGNYKNRLKHYKGRVT